MPIRVILADDHHIVRQGLRLVLEKEHIEVLAEASDGLEAIRLIKELLPEIAVLDLDMPGLDGLAVMREAALASPQTRTVILTRHMEEPYAVEALRIGARGYVLKTQASTDLVAAIRHVDRGEVYLSPKISKAVVEAYLTNTNGPNGPNGKLSVRERQVLQLVGEGHSTKKIAALLGISVKTADTHRTKVMEKLDIHQTAGLVRYAIRNGLIEP
jgi:DNA-binding NarL/FixJ family response regulator